MDTHRKDALLDELQNATTQSEIEKIEGKLKVLKDQGE